MSNKIDIKQMLLAKRLAGASGAPAGNEYLGHSWFAGVIAATVVLHMLALYAWHLSPVQQVTDIPVRALNIKLGDADIAADEQIENAKPDASNKSQVEDTLSKLVYQPGEMKYDRAKSVLSTMENAIDNMAKKVAPNALDKELTQDYLSKLTTPKQYVRESRTKGEGTALGNSTASHAEVMRRYEQMISLWIQKFKLYPEEARTQGLQGETVVRIRIDRQGNVRYYILERSTGYQLLDRAAIDMIRRANPVPAVPHDYPPGDLMEFLIPVTFHLQ
jgi:TonB family protein